MTAPTRTLDVELLQRTMAHIEAHPEQHNQYEWVATDPDCGTAACFAGWAAILKFGESVIHDDGLPHFKLPAPYDRDASGVPRAMSEQAAALLGLTLDQAHTLFDAGNSREALRLMVNDLVETGDLHGDSDYYDAEVDWADS